MRLTICFLGTLAVLPLQLQAADGSRPETIPLTRPEMKKTLEDHKSARPRLPLPVPSAEEKAQAGDRPVVNNGRMRQLYLPAELRGGDFVRKADPAMTLDPTFKTMLFWIVARSNDCRYCLGHQEWKLAAAGLSEDRVAALDCDWSRYTAAEQAAFALAQRLTHEPHTLSAEHLKPLREYYTDLQILEIVFTVSNNNATTRWTGGLNIPQDRDGAFFQRGGARGEDRLRSFLTPTSETFRQQPSKVAPGCKELERPPLEPRDRREAALMAARQRQPRLPLADEKTARAMLPRDWPAGPVPKWVRLLANFPVAGKARILSLLASEQHGNLDPRLHAEVAWIAARQDRAWYALDLARRRLERAGVSAQQIEALDGSWEQASPSERAAFSLVRKLTATPGQVRDADFVELRKHFSDGQTAELVYHLTQAAFLDRITEAAGLPVEP